MSSRALLAAGIALAFIASACGSSATNSDAAFVVQLSKFVISPGVVTCGALASAPDTILLQVEMVNTTGNDVSVVTTGASGVIIRSMTGDLVGTTAIAAASLPFTPQPSLVRATSGDVTVRIALPTAPLCFTNAVAGYKDIQVTARVSTNSGQYTSPSAVIHVFYQE